MAGVRVAILADDLIWSTRLADIVRAAGGEPTPVRRLDDLAGAVARGLDDFPARAVVDLTARAYDGVAAVRAASGAGARVIAVGQHDDADLRRRAREAGAEQVFAYRRLFEDGPRTIRAWLAR